MILSFGWEHLFNGVQTLSLCEAINWNCHIGSFHFVKVMWKEKV